MAVTLKEQGPGGRGIHFRLSTPHGPVHILVVSSGPPLAGPVVYLHGFYDSVDSAISKFRLLEQVQAAGQSGVFVFPDAPTGNDQPINWPNLESLFATIKADTGIDPSGPITAIGHSGAFSTILHWLSDTRLRRVVLLDALYGGVSQFVAWGVQPGHTLEVIVTPTGAPRKNAEAAGIPHVLSPLSHFGLITPPTSLLPGILRRGSTAVGLGAAVAIGMAALILWLLR